MGRPDHNHRNTGSSHILWFSYSGAGQYNYRVAGRIVARGTYCYICRVVLSHLILIPGAAGWISIMQHALSCPVLAHRVWSTLPVAHTEHVLEDGQKAFPWHTPIHVCIYIYDDEVNMYIYVHIHMCTCIYKYQNERNGPYARRASLR